ncbi:unnamed protein product, partial [Prorocentrum cordatum]
FQLDGGAEGAAWEVPPGVPVFQLDDGEESCTEEVPPGVPVFQLDGAEEAEGEAADRADDQQGITALRARLLGAVTRLSGLDVGVPSEDDAVDRFWRGDDTPLLPRGGPREPATAGAGSAAQRGVEHYRLDGDCSPSPPCGSASSEPATEGGGFAAQRGVEHYRLDGDCSPSPPCGSASGPRPPGGGGPRSSAGGARPGGGGPPAQDCGDWYDMEGDGPLAQPGAGARGAAAGGTVVTLLPLTGSPRGGPRGAAAGPPRCACGSAPLPDERFCRRCGRRLAGAGELGLPPAPGGWGPRPGDQLGAHSVGLLGVGPGERASAAELPAELEVSWARIAELESSEASTASSAAAGFGRGGRDSTAEPPVELEVGQVQRGAARSAEAGVCPVGERYSTAEPPAELEFGQARIGAAGSSRTGVGPGERCSTAELMVGLEVSQARIAEPEDSGADAASSACARVGSRGRVSGAELPAELEVSQARIAELEGRKEAASVDPDAELEVRQARFEEREASRAFAVGSAGAGNVPGETDPAAELLAQLEASWARIAELESSRAGTGGGELDGQQLLAELEVSRAQIAE